MLDVETTGLIALGGEKKVLEEALRLVIGERRHGKGKRNDSKITARRGVKGALWS